MLNRRAVLTHAVGMSLAGTPVLQALAQPASKYPERTVRIVVPFAAGSNTDVAGRMWAEILGKQLGGSGSVIVDNRAGAGGNIGAAAVATAKPDGYSLLYSTATTYAINPLLYSSLGFEPIKDFATVGVTISVPTVLIVSGDSPIKSFADLKKHVDENPGKYSYGSNGAGTSSHIACKVIANLLGHSELVHAPYKTGSGPVMTDVISGILTYAVDAWPVVGPLLKSGRLRALAVTSKERLSVAPDIPTLAELVRKDISIVTWNALWAPAGTPEPILDKLHAALAVGQKDPALTQRFHEQGTPMLPLMSRKECEQFMRQEIKRWKELIESANVKA